MPKHCNMYVTVDFVKVRGSFHRKWLVFGTHLVPQNFGNPQVIWAMKKPWLFRVYRGWKATQLYRDYNKPL